jgi:hypothetical protein
MIRAVGTLYLIIFLASCSHNKTVKEYYEDGTIKFIATIDEQGRNNGELKEYTNNGKLKAKGFWRSGQIQKVERYYPTGELEVEEVYSEGKVEGPTNYYYPNGKIQYVVNYKNGVRVGKYKVYSQEGNLLEEREYNESGQLIDYIKVDEKGHRIMDYTKAIIIAKQDTVTLNETYSAQIRLANRISDNLVVLIGPLNEKWQLTDTLQTLESSDHVFSYSTKGTKIGENILSGKVHEYIINRSTANGDKISVGDTISDMYSYPFVHKYYVLP